MRSFVDDDDLGPAQVARARLTGRSRSVPIAFRGLDYDRSKYASRAAGEMITAKPYRRADACVVALVLTCLILLVRIQAKLHGTARGYETLSAQTIRQQRRGNLTASLPAAGVVRVSSLEIGAGLRPGKYAM